jgi:hypothetical protein
MGRAEGMSMLGFASFGRLLRLGGLTFLVSTAACASSSAVRVGNVAYAPLPPSAPVDVFFSEQAIHRPFVIVGDVDVREPGNWEVLAELTQRARGIGANGIIVDETDVVVAGAWSRGFGGHARAIRLLSPAS